MRIRLFTIAVKGGKRMRTWKGGLTLVLLACGLVLLGCGKESPEPKAEKPAPEAKGAKTVIIGYTASKSGPLKTEGERQINGLNLWMEQVNAKGGITLADGTKVTVMDKHYDDQSKKTQVKQRNTQLT